MVNIKPNVLIIGGSIGAELLASQVAEKFQNTTVEIVTLEQAQDRGLVDNFPYKAPKAISIEPIILKEYPFYNDGKSARNKRREAERKAKKRK